MRASPGERSRARSNEARDLSGFHYPFHRPAVFLALLTVKLLGGESPPHAPAAAAGPARAEQLFEILPAVRCERMDFERQRCLTVRVIGPLGHGLMVLAHCLIPILAFAFMSRTPDQ